MIVRKKRTVDLIRFGVTVVAVAGLRWRSRCRTSFKVVQCRYAQQYTALTIEGNVGRFVFQAHDVYRGVFDSRQDHQS
jgi:hypothetical protein